MYNNKPMKSITSSLIVDMIGTSEDTPRRGSEREGKDKRCGADQER